MMEYNEDLIFFLMDNVNACAAMFIQYASPLNGQVERASASGKLTRVRYPDG